jgi:hypothetical protein
MRDGLAIPTGRGVRTYKAVLETTYFPATSDYTLREIRRFGKRVRVTD